MELLYNSHLQSYAPVNDLQGNKKAYRETVGRLIGVVATIISSAGYHAALTRLPIESVQPSFDGLLSLLAFGY